MFVNSLDSNVQLKRKRQRTRFELARSLAFKPATCFAITELLNPVSLNQSHQKSSLRNLPTTLRCREYVSTNVLCQDDAKKLVNESDTVPPTSQILNFDRESRVRGRPWFKLKALLYISGVQKEDSGDKTKSGMTSEGIEPPIFVAIAP